MSTVSDETASHRRLARIVWRIQQARQGRRLNVDRRKYCQHSSTDDSRQFTTLNVHFCQQRWTMSVMNWRLYIDYYSSHEIICIYMPVRLGCSPLRSVSAAFSSAVCLPTKSQIVSLVRQKAKHIAISDLSVSSQHIT